MIASACMTRGTMNPFVVRTSWLGRLTAGAFFMMKIIALKMCILYGGLHHQPTHFLRRSQGPTVVPIPGCSAIVGDSPRYTKGVINSTLWMRTSARKTVLGIRDEKNLESIWWYLHYTCAFKQYATRHAVHSVPRREPVSCATVDPCPFAAEWTQFFYSDGGLYGPWLFYKFLPALQNIGRSGRAWD